MHCHKCQHSREIAALQDRPEDEAARARLRCICSKCRQGDGFSGGGVSLDALFIDGTAARVLPVAPFAATFYTWDPGKIDGDEPAPARPTALSEEDEDTLRRMIATAVQLHPLQLLLALHAARRSTKTAAQAVRDFAAGIAAHKPNHYNVKSVFHAKWKSIVRKLPEFAAIRPATLARRG